MKQWQTIVAAAFVVVVLPISTHATSNEVSFTAITRSPSDGSILLTLLGPPNELVTVMWSDDLVSWEPLFWEEDETGQIVIIGFATDGDGVASVTDESTASIKKKFYRAMLWVQE